MTTVEIVSANGPSQAELAAVAGFLAGYCGATRTSYATDLRLFAEWCGESPGLAFCDQRKSRWRVSGACAG